MSKRISFQIFCDVNNVNQSTVPENLVGNCVSQLSQLTSSLTYYSCLLEALRPA